MPMGDRRGRTPTKDASSEYSISRFDEAAGNIAFHEIPKRDWSSDVCSSDLILEKGVFLGSFLYRRVNTCYR